ncbi:SAM-dependent methyltransferase [Archaeoglobus neptunius]|uniref:SAM-dependent methyltransferase n=1 Tax=Archaeoglobus neptunius TaxID=2798580 RepID=UPI00192801F0|nr:SAM-dependent methyltransferase [Archaeoglobus neptunius]
MLYGVGIGLTEGHLTLRAIEVIKKADEVIVPGKMAYEIVKSIREPRIVEFPMGDSENVVKNLAREISNRDGEKIAFCCLGDPVFYSTFHHLVNEVRKLNPDHKIEIVPGISSISVALAKTETFVADSALITTQDLEDTGVAVVLKVKKPREIKKELISKGFSDFILLERMFMDGERVYQDMPDKASYFSVLIARR